MTYEIKPLVPLIKEGLEETARALLEGKPIQLPLSGASGAGNLEQTSADNKNSKTQDNWTVYFNGRKEIMASAYGLYNTGKTGTPQLLKSLQEDFKESYVTPSTRIICNPASLESKIIHYYGSSIIKPEEKTIAIPHYSEKLLESVLSTNEGITYLQSLFSTNDSKEAITSTLENLSSYPKSKIKIWTPNQTSRKNYPQRAVRLYCNDDDFHVSCNGDLDYEYRSRGVLKSLR